MKEIINNLEYVIDDIETRIYQCLDRDDVVMLKRAKHEAMVLLRTLTYINQ
tara:strand:+ start:628 stop:780 length:153 start_codon:yes stop_codon:yes gene_type:complete